MGGIRDLIDSQKSEVEERCWASAGSIIGNSEFMNMISTAVGNNESEVSLYIDEILSYEEGHYPSDSEWELIIENMTDMLSDEGVKVTSHGWERVDDNDEADYWISLEW
jgi:hypothetical protein